MAGPLKDMLRAIGLSQDQVDGSLKSKACHLLCGKTPRYAMQTIGTEWGRDLIGNDIWVHVMADRIAEYAESKVGDALVVIDDVRFPNEVALVRYCKGEIWRVTRPGHGPAPWQQYIVSYFPKWLHWMSFVHRSERYWLTEKVDRDVGNHGTLEDLREVVEDLVT